MSENERIADRLERARHLLGAVLCRSAADTYDMDRVSEAEKDVATAIALLRASPVGEPVADAPEFSSVLLLPPWFTIDEVLDVQEKLRETIYATTNRDVYVRCKRAALPSAPTEGGEPEP